MLGTRRCCTARPPGSVRHPSGPPGLLATERRRMLLCVVVFINILLLCVCKPAALSLRHAAHAIHLSRARNHQAHTRHQAFVLASHRTTLGSPYTTGAAPMRLGSRHCPRLLATAPLTHTPSSCSLPPAAPTSRGALAAGSTSPALAAPRPPRRAAAAPARAKGGSSAPASAPSSGGAALPCIQRCSSAKLKRSMSLSVTSQRLATTDGHPASVTQRPPVRLAQPLRRDLRNN